MSTARLLALAKGGDPQAIATLINQQLRSRGITAIAARVDDCLRLLLEAEQQPEQRPVEQYLGMALTKLSASVIQRVEIYGRRQGSPTGWQSCLSWREGQFVLDEVSILLEEQAEAAVGDRDPSAKPEKQALDAELQTYWVGAIARQSRPKASASKSFASSSSGSRSFGSRPSRSRAFPFKPLASKSPGLSPLKGLVSHFSLPRISLPRISVPRMSLPEQAEGTALAQSWSQLWTRLAKPLTPYFVQFIAPIEIWLQWQGAALLATLLTVVIAFIVLGLVFFGIFSLVNRLSETVVLILFVVLWAVIAPILGLLLGNAQTLVLRPRLGRLARWRWFTMLGVMVGLAIAWGTHIFLSHSLGPFILNPTSGFVIGRGISFVATGIGVMFGLLGLSTVQWLAIRPAVPRAYEWVLVNVFGGCLSWVLGMMASSRWITPLVENSSSYDFWTQLVVIAVGGLFSWLLFHALSGIGMARLLHRLPLQVTED